MREHYLRGASEFASLPEHEDDWLAIDTNVVLHQIDLISAAAFPLPLLVAQTVLDEVRHRSLPLYNRLRTLLDDELDGSKTRKRGHVVWNEAIDAMYVQRSKDESPNDRNDRAIRRMAKYLQDQHSAAEQQQQPPAKKKKKQETSATTTRQSKRIRFLSDDAENVKRAKSEGIEALSVRDFVASLDDKLKLELEDLVASPDAPDAVSRQKGAVIFDEHLPPSTLQVGVKSGKFLQGFFNPSTYNYLEATVNSSTIERPILLVGREAHNRAVSGDVVAVELLPESEWRSTGDDVVDADALNKNDDPEGEDVGLSIEDRAANEAAASSSSKSRRQPTGRVVGIVKRNWRTYVCHLDRSSLPPAALSSTQSVSVFASPVARTIPRIRILTRQAAHLSSQKFLVAIDRWQANARYPDGHFVRALGDVGSKQGELESLLEEFEVPYRPFSAAILDCLPPEGDTWVVPPKDNDPKGVWQGREDLRDVVVCSIDPPGCQDIDDALHARPLPNGNIEAGVHIADVSHFVKPDNPMDAEAASRGTTVYLVDKRIDMLPGLLGTNLCSLRPYVERLAFSVIWELNKDAEIVNVRFTKSVIASKEAFTYEAAQKRKDDKSLSDPLTVAIRLLNEIAIKLRNKRFAAGALNLASPEVKIHMESAESTEPIDVEQKALYETNHLVEEFMLLANISVAQRIYEQYPQTAVLRRHAAPPKTNFEQLQDVLATRRNMPLDTSSSGALAKSLDKCIDPSIPNFNTLVRIMATRCMLSAEYFCSGSLAYDAFAHYGLASPIYTHFTSPIRRYADVLVHRQLAAAVSRQPLHAGLQTKGYVERTLDVVNKRHRGAQHAGRASIEFYVALSIEQREQASLKSGTGKVRAEAFVIRAFRNGLAVFVSQ